MFDKRMISKSYGQTFLDSLPPCTIRRSPMAEIGPAAKQVLPVIERVYLKMIQELADKLRGDDPDDLDNEYVLAEFLDRYGMRLSQLGTIMGQLAPIADATPPPPFSHAVILPGGTTPVNARADTSGVREVTAAEARASPTPEFGCHQAWDRRS